jgi:PIN domain nuclease of toxin-antitoxin system
VTPLLLDTCALIWSSDSNGLQGEAADAIRTSMENGMSVFVSPISAWEIGMLIDKGRLTITENPHTWLRRLILKDGVRLAEMTVDMLLTSASLPDLAHGDPADRIIIATAREYGLRIVTRDRKILDYADKGHVLALAC